MLLKVEADGRVLYERGMSIRERLLQDITDLGLPTVYHYRRGLAVFVHPDNYGVGPGEDGIAFTLTISQ